MHKPTLEAAAISGVFIYAHNPKALSEWYSQHLGLAFNYWDEQKSYGTEFIYSKSGHGPAERRSNVFAIHPTEGTPSTGERGFKLQFQVGDLKGLIAKLVKSGVKVDDSKDYPYGRFAWLRDLEGNRIELYQPL